MRMQPEDTKPPIESGRFVPWIAYSPPDSVNAATPIGLLGDPPGITRVTLDGDAQAGLMYLPSICAVPAHCMPALPTPPDSAALDHHRSRSKAAARLSSPRSCRPNN